MIFVLLFVAGFVTWTVSTLSGGGGSILLVALVIALLGADAVAPVVTLASLFAGPARAGLLWRRIDWQVVAWYLPVATVGAVLGAWTFTWLPGRWLNVAIGLFLVSTAWQYRLGGRARSFVMPLGGFLPLGAAVGAVSGLVGASGLVANPFYLNYGLIKESLLATRAVNSLGIQLAKLGTYAAFGVLGTERLGEGLAAGAGAIAGIWCSNHLLPALDESRFRRFAVLVMFASGLVILWQQRTALIGLLAR